MQYESCISLTRTTLTTLKSKRKEKNISKQRKDKNNHPSPYKNNISSPSLQNLIIKCNLLKNRANKILTNYISLTEYAVSNFKLQK